MVDRQLSHRLRRVVTRTHVAASLVMVVLLVLIIVLVDNLQALFGLPERVVRLGLLPLFCFPLLPNLVSLQLLLPAALEPV